MIGKRNVLATFRRAVETGRDGANAPILEWDDLLSVFAKKTDVSDVEKIAAGEEASAIKARFVFPASPKSKSITTADQIFAEGRTWNIKGVKTVIEAGRDKIEVTAVARSGA